MNIIIIAQRYAPEDISGAIFAADLAETLHNSGHNVTVVTEFPNYPHGETFVGYRKSLFTKEILNGVQILRVWSHYSKSRSKLGRVYNWLTYGLTVSLTRFLVKRPDIIFAYLPPLTTGITVWLLKLTWRVPVVLRVEDIFPDAAINTGVVSNKLLINTLIRLEKLIYRGATKISVITPKFKDKLIEKGVSREKIVTNPLWADISEISPYERNTPFREKHKLGDKFVVMYSGNLGVTSAIEDLIKAANTTTRSQVHYVIIGQGTKKPEILEYCRQNSLNNITFLDFQPRQNLGVTLGSADLCVVTLNSMSEATSLPSKLFNYMASQRPILAIAPRNSDLGKLIIEHEIGVVIEPGDPLRVSQCIELLLDQPHACHMMGVAARKLVESQFAKDTVIAQYARMLQSVIDGT